MHLQSGRRIGAHLAGFAAASFVCVGCQQQNVTPAPESIAVWADPLNEDSAGQSILDVNDDPTRLVLIDQAGRVVFSTGDSCNDCTTDFETATIDLGGDNFIDIRFGRGVDLTGVRRPFLVDAASGNYIQLVGGGGSSPVTFQVTTEPFEEDNDPSDDRAVFVRVTAVSSGSSGSGSSPLCGILGGGAIGVFVLGLVTLTFTRRSLRRRPTG